VKNIRISDESHKYLMLQRAITGVPASRQVDEMIQEKKNEACTEESKNVKRADRTKGCW